MRVSSWFGAAGAVAARRDWLLHDDATGARLGAATSTWLPFSLASRRMVRMPPELRTFFLTRSPQPPRWALGEAFAPAKCDAVPADAPGCASLRHCVRRADVDMNRHVNNARYLAWLLENVPPDVAAAHFAAGVDVEYRAECGIGDEVHSRTTLHNTAEQEEGDETARKEDGDAGGVTCHHALLRVRDNAEVLRARTHWRPRRLVGERDCMMDAR